MCLSIVVDSPNRLLSEGKAFGFQWVVTHNEMGYRCGYIRLPEGHPWHGRNYNSIDALVHGDLTFSEPDKSCDAPGPDSDWWIGFDCSHAFDAPDPALPGGQVPPIMFPYSEIRTQEFVEEQCRRLCWQAYAARLANNLDTFQQAVTETAKKFSDAFTRMLQLLAPSLPNTRQPWWPLDVTDTSGSFGRFVWVNSDDCGWGYCFWEDDDIE